MKASADIFGILRERVPIEEVAGARVGEKILCPVHADGNTPNLHVYDDHAYCFACGFRGDVTDLWAATRNIDSSIEAALDLAREYGVEVPQADPETRRLAAERREKEDNHLTLARACHKALEKHPRVRRWWENRGFGSELRERFLLGANRDGTEAVIPYWNRGRVHALVRRKLEGEPRYRYPKAEEFPSGYRPLFVPGEVTGRKDVVLVEGIVDALAGAALGENIVAVGSAEPSARQLEELGRSPGDVYVLPDDDEAGRRAARKSTAALYPIARMCPPEYGEGLKDLADLFAASSGAKGEAAAVVDGLKERAQDALALELSEAPGEKNNLLAYRKDKERILPLLVRLEDEGEREAALHDVANRMKLSIKPMRKTLAELVESEAERKATRPDECGPDETQAGEVVPEEEYRMLLTPGVLDRYVGVAASLQGVVGDEPGLKLLTLVAVSAQLGLLPNNKPIGASCMLIGDPGRGKNYLTDCVVSLLPEAWYLGFESASGTSMYYQIEKDPAFLRHRFMYPNEAEAADTLVEFLRPMLSAGKATRFTVNSKGRDGANEAQELKVVGPVTAIIPTVRNKLDEQLQTRLLVAELEDYEGRVKKHSQAVSRLLSPDYAVSGIDISHAVRRWRAALKSLTGVRRVVFPLGRDEFAFDNDAVSHGARLWANLLGLMSAHAWLEQRNRRLVDVNGATAIIATPDDYEAAYRIFEATCQRTVTNLSKTHRKILDAVHELEVEDPDAEGFSQRKIAEQGDVSVGAVSKHKAFLVRSTKLLRETDHGLALVSGAEPSWWSGEALMTGFPSPEKVKEWWDEEHPPPDGPSGKGPRQDGTPTANTAEKSDPEGTRETREHPTNGGPREPHRHADNGPSETVNTCVSAREHSVESVQGVFTPRSRNRSRATHSENSMGKGNGRGKQQGVHAVHGFRDTPGEESNGSKTSSGAAVYDPRASGGQENGDARKHLAPEDDRRIRELVRQGMSPRWARAEVLRHPLDCGCEACR